jgi:solute carrier family 25 protein 33/36
MSNEIKPKKQQFSVVNHFVAGGLGGAVGAVVTSPFDVIKTRLQSSGYSLEKVNYGSVNLAGSNQAVISTQTKQFSAVFTYMRYMIKSEGWRSLYRGLELHLVGTAPSRAIYFAVYSNSKNFFLSTGKLKHDSAILPMASSVIAGFTTSTMTNPIWFLKTRLQLECSRYGGEHKGLFRTIQNIYRKEGIRKFYCGLSASYLGIGETVIHFLIYEQMKIKITKFYNRESSKSFHFSTYVMASTLSKSTAAIIGYPHEVLRTRLRQQSNEVLGRARYRSIMQTARTILKEEGWMAFYSGLWTHLLRQVPNTVILLLTYEGVVHYLER